MPTIKYEDLSGFHINKEICCYDCVTEEEYEEATLDKVITYDFIQESDDVFFCDRCKKIL